VSSQELHKGNLLIAQPNIINDNSFNRSIILLTEHTPVSSVGFILNRPLDCTVKDLLPEIDCGFQIYEGGPVEQENLYFVHRVPHLIGDSMEIGDGICWGGNFESLKSLLNKGLLQEDEVRFFLGYSGWGKDQLKNEIRTDSWFVSKDPIYSILSTDISSLWRDKIIKKGGTYKLWANAPKDVSLN
tara:strand:+ start:86939 stop:87496 length:558 start_codon:yes stop_codon:yes gene_type:complete